MMRWPSRASVRWLLLVAVPCSLVGILSAASGDSRWNWLAAWRRQTTPPAASAPWVPRRIHALGRLEPHGKVVRVAPPSGNDSSRVESLLVEEGDDVPANSVLALLDTNARRKADFGEAMARLKVAEARLDQTRAGAKSGEILAQQSAVDLLEEQTKVAMRELERAERFRNQKAISGEDYDKHKWTYDRTVFEAERARQMLHSISEVREIDVRVQELDVAAATAAVAAARSRLEATEVRNPAAGRVLKIHARPGERIGDAGLLEMGDVSHMHAVAEVFEGDVQSLAAGMSATVMIDSTGERLTGIVEELGHVVGRKVVLTNDPVSDTDARVLEVRIRLGGEDSRRVARLSNARVEVTIELDPPVSETAVVSEPAGH